MEKNDPITEAIIGCAIEVHRVLGPGLLESSYEGALCVEFATRGLHFERQAAVPVVYKGQLVGDLRLDLLVEDQVVVEVKASNASILSSKLRFSPISGPLGGEWASSSTSTLEC